MNFNKVLFLAILSTSFTVTSIELNATPKLSKKLPKTLNTTIYAEKTCPDGGKLSGGLCKIDPAPKKGCPDGFELRLRGSGKPGYCVKDPVETDSGSNTGSSSEGGTQTQGSVLAN